MSALAGQGRGRPYVPGARRSLRRTLALQARVVGALMMREATAKFGHENLGFFWVMGEPLVLTVGVMVMWTITGAGHGHGVGIVPFALSGYSLLTLWRHITGAGVHVIRRNADLLFHRNVRVLDILISRALLETLGILTAFFIAYIPLALLGFVDPFTDPLLVVGAFLLQGWYAFGFGLIITGLSEMSEAVERFVPPVLYITLPFTGIFYMLSWLPESARDVLVWSPLVSTCEMLRAGMFSPDIPTYYYPWYVAANAMLLTAIGFLVIEKAQKHVAME